MIKPSLDQFIKYSEAVEIFDKYQGKISDFKLSSEQKEIISNILENPKNIILKGRQIGSTTVCCFIVFILALLNENFSCMIAADVQANSKAILDKIKRFAESAGTPLVSCNTKEIVFENGSKIEAKTARQALKSGEGKLGRSGSYQVVLLSEFAFYDEAEAQLASVLATMSSSESLLIIESTSNGRDNHFYNLYSSENSYNKMFFSVEAHKAYRLSGDLISDTQWDLAKSKYGFTDRESASWWLNKLKGDYSNNEAKMLKEFPVLPEHSFSVKEGRFIEVDPKVINPIRILPSKIEIYKEYDSLHSYIIGFDPASGKGGDNTALVVIDKCTKELCAYFSRNDVLLQDVFQVCKELLILYKADFVIFEENGLGQNRQHEFSSLSIPVQYITTTESSKYSGLEKVRSEIFSGVLFGGNRIYQEVNSLKYDDNKFFGKKDTLMAIGFCLNWLDKNGLDKVKVQTDPNVRIYKEFPSQESAIYKAFGFKKKRW